MLAVVLKLSWPPRDPSPMAVSTAVPVILAAVSKSSVAT